MKLINSKYLFMIIIVWMFGFIIFVMKNYICCFIPNKYFPTDVEQSYFYSLLGNSIDWEMFSIKSHPIPNSYATKCNISQINHQIVKQSVAEKCSTNLEIANSIKQLTAKERHILLRHLIVNDEYKLIYCYTPKVACSNWKKVMKQLYGNLKDEDFIHMDHNHGFTYLADFSEKEIEDKLKNYFKFMFVRNPSERAVSVYRNKFNSIESFYKVQGKKIKELYNPDDLKIQYKGKVQGDDVSFQEMMQFIATGVSAENMDEHFMPLTTLCQPCIVKYDFFGVYDNIDEDSEIVLRAIKAPADVHFPTRQSWYKPTTDVFMQYYFSLLSSDLLKQFIDKYSFDFSLFSFPKPRHVTSSFYRTDQTFCYQ